MLKSNLHPPRDGLNADPILYGVAAGLAALFPLVDTASSRDERPAGEAGGGQESLAGDGPED